MRYRGIEDIFRQALTASIHSQFQSLIISEAKDEEEALQTIPTFLPDLIFTDIRLPERNGLDLTKMIKMDHPDIIVVLLTSYDLPEYRQAGLQSKEDYFVTKDSPTQNFLELVESLCPGQKHDGNNLIGQS